MPNLRNKKTKKDDVPQIPIKTLPAIPDGYVEGITNEGQVFIVPQYMLEYFESQNAGKQKKTQLQLLKSSTGGGVPHGLDNFDRITEFGIKFPPDPQLSQHDLLEQHAEIMALRERLGISYKDACHRLYLAEVEHLRAEREALFAFEELEENITAALEAISKGGDK